MHVYPAHNLCGFHNVVLYDGYMHYNRNRSAVNALDMIQELCNLAAQENHNQLLG
jgi:hypothetical protein